MSVLDRALQLLDRIHEPPVARAHCDIPCGIYDPHAAQIAALTVIRMVQLLQGAQPPSNNASKNDWDTYTMQVSRYTTVKEHHGQLCENEIVTLWADYFKPEHVQQHPNLHELVWNTVKLTGTVRQQINMDAAQQLLQNCQQIAEIFWQTKGVQTRRQPSNQGAVGGELVYPVAG